MHCKLFFINHCLLFQDVISWFKCVCVLYFSFVFLADINSILQFCVLLVKLYSNKNSNKMCFLYFVVLF